MNTLRLNITLPIDIGKSLQHMKNKSAFIAQSIREKIAREKQAAAEKELAAAYKASAEEDRALRAEWDGVSGDGL